MENCNKLNITYETGTRSPLKELCVKNKPAEMNDNPDKNIHIDSESPQNSATISARFDVECNSNIDENRENQKPVYPFSPNVNFPQKNEVDEVFLDSCDSLNVTSTLNDLPGSYSSDSNKDLLLNKPRHPSITSTISADDSFINAFNKLVLSPKIDEVNKTEINTINIDSKEQSFNEQNTFVDNNLQSKIVVEDTSITCEENLEIVNANSIQENNSEYTFNKTDSTIVPSDYSSVENNTFDNIPNQTTILSDKTLIETGNKTISDFNNSNTSAISSKEISDVTRISFIETEKDVSDFKSNGVNISLDEKHNVDDQNLLGTENQNSSGLSQQNTTERHLLDTTVILNENEHNTKSTVELNENCIESKNEYSGNTTFEVKDNSICPEQDKSNLQITPEVDNFHETNTENNQVEVELNDNNINITFQVNESSEKNNSFVTNINQEEQKLISLDSSNIVETNLEGKNNSFVTNINQDIKQKSVEEQNLILINTSNIVIDNIENNNLEEKNNSIVININQDTPQKSVEEQKSILIDSSNIVIDNVENNHLEEKNNSIVTNINQDTPQKSVEEQKSILIDSPNIVIDNNVENNNLEEKNNSIVTNINQDTPQKTVEEQNLILIDSTHNVENNNLEEKNNSIVTSINQGTPQKSAEEQKLILIDSSSNVENNSLEEKNNSIISNINQDTLQKSVEEQKLISLDSSNNVESNNLEGKDNSIVTNINLDTLQKSEEQKLILIDSPNKINSPNIDNNSTITISEKLDLTNKLVVEEIQMSSSESNSDVKDQLTNRISLENSAACTNQMGDIINQDECFEKQLDISNGAVDNKESLEAKARLYKEMAEKYTMLEAEAEKYKTQVNDLKKELKICRQKTVALETEVADLKRKENELTILLEEKTKSSDKDDVNEQEAQIKRLQTSEEALKNEVKELKGLVKQHENTLKDLQRKEVKLADDLSCKTQSELQISRIMEEYEKSISVLVSENEKMKKERDTAQMHLANIEMAFSDVHQKYERCKAIVQGYKDNEESFKQDIAMNRETIVIQEQKYETLKAHAMAQLEKSNQELAAMKKQHEAEVARLTAQLKRYEIKNMSLMESLQQKAKECEQLSAVCDEFIGNV